jgi:hypothetical protein
MTDHERAFLFIIIVESATSQALRHWLKVISFSRVGFTSVHVVPG